MRSAETHRAVYLEISFLQLLLLHHLPEIIYQTQGLEPPEHLSSDLLHYAYDLHGHAGLPSHHVQVSWSQPCLAVQYRSMFGLKYPIDVGWKMSVDGKRVSSVDGGERVSVDERVLLSIDEERIPLWIERSKHAGSDENSS
ncbi:hypothetical protein F2Q70_00038505 [Brassica cretica]|uniref:Uncharacterized protein n=1 Tax=Brassica cretica TaxID=69181 RepID=A0A8S9M8T5_BRACR|nr:hypothetical protein F2Q70_00038505 [Brassica cretica]KAF2616470.1 hypothetical protein F2Q68_00039135 [Brassica cretica]